MKRLFLCPSTFSRLMFGVVVALPLHALGLFYFHWQRTRPLPPDIFQSTDNTPELLEFSSQATPLKPLDPGPLPKALVLPPPRTSSWKTRHSSQAAGRKLVGTIANPSNHKFTRVPGRRSSKGLLQSSRGSQTPANWMVGQPSQAGSSVDWSDVLRHLRAFQRDEEGISALSGSDSPEPRSISNEHGESSPVLQNLDASQQEAYQGLWERARPILNQPWPRGLAESKGPPIEVRQLRFDQPLPSDLQISHRQIVVLGDQVLLFLLDEKRSWLLRSVRKAPSPT